MDRGSFQNLGFNGQEIAILEEGAIVELNGIANKLVILLIV